jgi:hypothetical protein
VKLTYAHPHPPCVITPHADDIAAFPVLESKPDPHS